MKHFLLNKVRLSWYLVFFLVVYTILAFTLPRTKFDAGALTLFSVNSFLYGFYIAPILSGQKARIEDLHKLIRNETNAIFDIMLRVKKLPDRTRKEVQDLMEEYIRYGLIDHNIHTGEVAYEAAISYCMTYKGPKGDQVEKILDKLVANQQNRTLITMQIKNSVYSNEWIIMMVLFSITLGFILYLDTGHSVVFKLVIAFLCTGLSMLLVILAKLSTLTHKKARQMWNPPKKLLESDFYRFD
jgi:hypothetical protein